MSERIPQSTSKLVVFRAYLASDGKTPATGKTIAITISKNGATSFSNPNAGATNATEMASGFYKFTLDTTDTGTTGPIAWRGAEGTIDDAGDVYSVVDAANAGFTATDTILSRIGTPSNLGGGATLAQNLSDIESQTDDIGTAGAGLTAVPWNAAWDAEVQSEVDDALVAQNLDHLVKSAVDTNFATTVHADSVMGQIADNGAGFDRTTDSLEAIRDRGDAAWTTATGFSTHSASDVWAVATRRLSSGGIDDILDEVVEGSTTLRQMIRGFAAAMLGKASGLETTSAVYRDIGDSKDRITATVDADGNRTAVTLDLT